MRAATFGFAVRDRLDSSLVFGYANAVDASVTLSSFGPQLAVSWL